MAGRIEDQIDYDPVTGIFTWRVGQPRGRRRAGDRAGSLNSKGYRRIFVCGKYYSEHRLAFLLMTGSWPTEQVDHINNIRDDNRWTNLREATAQQNTWNSRAYGESGIKGVHKHNGRWQVLDAENNYICVTDDLELARKLASESRQAKHGEFFNGRA